MHVLCGHAGTARAVHVGSKDDRLRHVRMKELRRPASTSNMHHDGLPEAYVMQHDVYRKRATQILRHGSEGAGFNPPVNDWRNAPSSLPQAGA
jgi:hypothetical protein